MRVGRRRLVPDVLAGRLSGLCSDSSIAGLIRISGRGMQGFRDLARGCVRRDLSVLLDGFLDHDCDHVVVWTMSAFLVLSIARRYVGQRPRAPAPRRSRGSLASNGTPPLARCTTERSAQR